MNKRILAAIIFVIIGIFGSVQLLLHQLISEASFLALVGGCVIVGLFIIFIDRISSFSLRDMKIELRELRKETDELRSITVTLTKMMLLQSAIHGRIGSEQFYSMIRRWTENHASKLLATVQAQGSEWDTAFAHFRAIEAAGKLDKQDKHKREAAWKSVFDAIKEDTKNA
jgi:hypothetical protein